MIKNKATFARISYRTALGNSDSEQIPLGLLVKFSSETEMADYVILLSKESLSEEQRAKLGYMAQTLLKNPSEYLQVVIDQVVKKKEGDFFQNLASELMWSVFMSPSVSVQIPEEVIADLSSILEKNFLASVEDKAFDFKMEDVEEVSKHYIYGPQVFNNIENSTSIPIELLYGCAPVEFESDVRSDNRPKAWMAEKMSHRVHCH